MRPGNWRIWAGVAVVLLAGVGLLRVRLRPEVLDLLPADLASVAALRLHQVHFSEANELWITVRGPDAEAALTAARQLAERLGRETPLVARVVWESPLGSRRDEAARLLACLWLNRPPAELEALAQRLAPDRLPQVAREARDTLSTTLSPDELARLAYDPFGLTRLPGDLQLPYQAAGANSDGFASGDGLFRVIQVTARPALEDYRAAAAWLSQIRSLIEEAARNPGYPAGIQVRCTGRPAFVAETAMGMQRDLGGSALGTLGVVAVLFWLAHRSWRPLLAMTVLLLGTTVLALASGGLVYGELYAVSFGFAAVLLGLAEDYAVVLYQEWKAHPSARPEEVRRAQARSIVGSAITTALAFLLLNFSGLPGLEQLGTLVALGVLLGAGVMLYGFLALAIPRRKPSPVQPATPEGTPASTPTRPKPWNARVVWGATALAAAAAVTALVLRPPVVDPGVRALEPRESEAATALAEMNANLGAGGDPILLLFSGEDEASVSRQLQRARQRLAAAETQGVLRSFQLPDAVWPNPGHQRVNRVTAERLVSQADAFRDAALGAGFNEEGLRLGESMLAAWAEKIGSPAPVVPDGEGGRWLMGRFAARTGDGWLVLGTLQPAGALARPAVQALIAGLRSDAVQVTGWPLLAEELLGRVRPRSTALLVAVMAILCVCLRLVFWSWREVGLSLATLGFGLVLLSGFMGGVGWNWNLMNLTALPLLMGMGVDYTIHLQMALRRHGGDLRAVLATTGRAVLLCALTTAAGFGSLGFSSNLGLASLGQVCATGVLVMMGLSLGLLPGWWRTVCPPGSSPGTLPDRPSKFYRAGLWRAGLRIVRAMPAPVCNAVCVAAAELYWRFQPERRALVESNLAPLLGADPERVRGTARRLFRQFALKLADLWRYEAGLPIDGWMVEWSGWEAFVKAHERGQGVLLVIPHLGNWELGAPLLVRKGHPLLVLTQAEPERGLTALRQESRARWGVETLVVGHDAFAFVEIIKRLQAGATVALLVDRPTPSGAVTVDLFGRPFQASIAAAELARASGAAILPGYVVRANGGYGAHILPEIPYDRRALGDREARRQLTQQILRAFEPVLRQHPDQWYHFVPVWDTARARG